MLTLILPYTLIDKYGKCMQRVSQSVTVCLKDNTVCALPVPLIRSSPGWQ